MHKKVDRKVQDQQKRARTDNHHLRKESKRRARGEQEESKKRAICQKNTAIRQRGAARKEFASNEPAV